MSCQISYTTDGKITRVNTPSGEESKLFNQIAKLPHVDNLQEALDIYKTKYKDGVSDEAPLVFISDSNNVFSSYKEALLDSKGGDIEIKSGENQIMLVSSNTNTNTLNGLINNLIKENLLSDEKIISDGQTFHKASGHDVLKQLANENVIKPLRANTKIHKDGRIEFKKDKENKPSLLKELLNNANVFGKSSETPSEKVLKERLMQFLGSIGVTITNMDNYNKNYKTRNSVDVSAQALADISNQVIAFREGAVSTEVLTEEVAHFIVEGWNNEDIDNLLRNIHKTESYQQNAETYREIYQKEYPNEDVENLVRREVLGKELAKALQNRFSTENKTEFQSNFIKRLYNLFMNFIGNLSLNENYRQQLDNLTDKVEEMLLNKDIKNYINTEQFVNKKFRLYSVSPLNNPHHALVKALQEQEKILIKVGKGSSQQLQELQSYLSSEMEKKVVKDLINLANRQTRYILEAMKEANKRGTTLSNEENIIFNNLKNVIFPALSLLKTKIDKNSEYNSEVSDIVFVQAQISDSIGLIQQNDNRILEDIVDRLVKRANRDVKMLPDGTLVEDNTLKEELLSAIKTAKKDTKAIHYWYGNLTHASDPVLGILGSVIGDIYNESAEAFQTETKDFQNKLRELGFKERDLQQFVQEDGYIVSQWDFNELDEYVRYCRAKAYKDNLDAIIKDCEDRGITGKELEEHKKFKSLSNNDAKFLETFIKVPEISNVNLLQKVKTEAQKEQNNGTEPFLSKEFLDKQEKRLEGLSEETKKHIRNFSQMRGQVRRSMKKSKNGFPIYSIQDKLELDSIASQKAYHMSVYTTEGGKKPGLDIVPNYVDGAVEMSNGQFLTIDRSQATEESIVAFELHLYNRRFIEEAKDGSFSQGVSDAWMKELKDMEADGEITRQDIIDWVNLNTTFGFSNDFFRNRKDSVIKEYENDPEISDTIEEYKNLLDRRKNLLNQYKDTKNSVNTMVNTMPNGVKESIKDLSAKIDDLSNEIFRYIEKQDSFVKEERLEDTAQVKPNEAYYAQLQDSNLTTIEEKLKFAMSNMTDRNRRRVDEYLQALNGGTKTNSMKELMNKFGNSKEGALAFAESKLLPYYQSYAPKALQEYYDKVRNTNTPISSLIEELKQDSSVRISVSYEYLDKANDEMLNPNRLKDFKGGAIQPSLTKKPILFGKQFDFNNKNWNKISSNKKLLELHNAYVEYKSKAHKYMDYEEGNIYLMPQVPESRIEMIQGALKGGATDRVKEVLAQIKEYRVGDIAEGELDEEGQSLYKSNIKVIPRYYTRKLEKQSNVSKNIFYSTALMMQQATLRDARVRNYSEVSAIMDAIENQSRYDSLGKQASATNTYRMAKSYVDNAIFGVEDVARARMNIPIVGEVDATKVVKNIHRWKQNINLAFNPIIPLTSFVTAKTGLIAENLLQQYIDKDTALRVQKLTYINGFKGKADALELYSQQEAVVLLERFGLFNLSNRFENSKYGKLTRLIGNSAYVLHQMGDYPIKTEVIYSSLVGHRISNGRVLDYKDFLRLNRQAGKDDATIKLEWKDLKSLYDYVEVKDGKMNYKSELYTDLNTTEEGFKEIEKTIAGKARQLAQRVDGSIRDEERTFAQRHFLLRYTMTHRGWLSLAIANRFKDRQFNLQTQQWEEGTYRTFASLVDKTFKSLFKKNSSSLKEVWMTLNEEEKVNLQRVLVELGVLGTVYALMLVLAGFADDDEDDYTKQLLAYLFERVTNETTSAQEGVVKEMYSALKEPVVGSNQILQTLEVYKLLTGDELVKTGRYHGMTERERWIIRNFTGIKPAYDIFNAKNIKSQRDSYNHFQGENEFNPFIHILSKKEYLEEEDE